MQDDIRYYRYEDKRYPSVTSIIKTGLPKEALNNWKIRQVIDKAANLRKDTAKMNKADTVRLLKEEDNAIRDTARDTGNDVHRYIECVIKGETPPSLDATGRAMARQFESFIAEYRPTFTGSEVTCYSDRFLYAGTQDLEFIINGVKYAADIKTGKRIYPEVAMQLAAYDNSDFRVSSDGRRTDVERVGRGIALHVRTDACIPYTVDISKATFDHFLSLRDTFEWITNFQHYVVNGKLESDD